MGARAVDVGSIALGPFSAQAQVGRTPSPIIAVALVGGAGFWVVFAFLVLPRWERVEPAVRSASLCLFVLAWVLTGAVQLALLG